MLKQPWVSELVKGTFPIWVRQLLRQPLATKLGHLFHLGQVAAMQGQEAWAPMALCKALVLTCGTLWGIVHVDLQGDSGSHRFGVRVHAQVRIIPT